MTIEQLLGKSADELAALTDAQLNEYFAPYLVVTRPELASKPEKGNVRKANTYNPNFNLKKQKALEMARQLGIELEI